jgi:uncharacterized membrane protein (GlpM family)
MVLLPDFSKREPESKFSRNVPKGDYSVQQERWPKRLIRSLLPEKTETGLELHRFREYWCPSMQLLLKIVLSVTIILAATAVAKKFPSLAGLVGVMPLTGALVLVWVYLESNGNQQIMISFARGALWGMLPSLLFFLVAFFCFRKGFSLPLVLGSSFLVWIAAACAHQWMLK